MKVIKLEEAGYDAALAGIALSYNSKPSKRVADNLAFKGGGHSKFLESIDVWLLVTASRMWWAQADTYRLSTKQSESTMHTILRTEFTQEMFSGWVFPETIERLNFYRSKGDFKIVKDNLPESFLQTREWKLPYNVLQNMERQRRTHKLAEWQEFLDAVLFWVNNPEWIVK